MVARLQEPATSQSLLAHRTGTLRTGPDYSPSTLYQLQIAILELRVAALEAEVEHQRRQRQAVVDKYERLLEPK
jgi:hypothetical protein